jgi:hypothetical protein
VEKEIMLNVSMRLGGRGGLGDDPALEVRPLVTLHVEHARSNHGEDHDGLHPHTLALVVFRLGTPVQEGGHVLSHLTGRGRGAWDHAGVGKNA